MAFSSKINSITSPALSPLRVIKIRTWVYYNGFYEKDHMFINQHVYHGPFMIFFFPTKIRRADIDLGEHPCQ